MAGRMGGDRVKLINLQVVKIIPEKNVVVVKELFQVLIIH